MSQRARPERLDRDRELGTIDDLPNAVDSVNGVIVASSAFATADLNRAVRSLLGADIHVHMSSGLTGISYKRLRPLPLAREPLFYIEQLRPPAMMEADHLPAVDVAFSFESRQLRRRGLEQEPTAVSQTGGDGSRGGARCRHESVQLRRGRSRQRGACSGC